MNGVKKINAATLEKAFPKAYIENNLNGRRTYKALKGNHIKDTTAGVEASKILAKPSVRKSIEALLPSEEKTMEILSDVYEARREKILSYKELHKFWETDLKLRGKLKEKGDSKTNIGIYVGGPANTTTHVEAKKVDE